VTRNRKDILLPKAGIGHATLWNLPDEARRIRGQAAVVLRKRRPNHIGWIRGETKIEGKARRVRPNPGLDVLSGHRKRTPNHIGRTRELAETRIEGKARQVRPNPGLDALTGQVVSAAGLIPPCERFQGDLAIMLTLARQPTLQVLEKMIEAT
jgi:hypothetical protein